MKRNTAKAKFHHRMRQSWCPNPACQGLLSGYAEVEPEAKESRPICSGAFAVCVYCGTICMFTNANEELRPATASDMRPLDPLDRAMMKEASGFYRTAGHKPKHRRPN